jgi:hypothetical protein
LNLQLRHQANTASGNFDRLDDAVVLASSQTNNGEENGAVDGLESNRRAPLRKVISINGEEVDEDSANIHDFTTFEKEELIGPAFIEGLKRKSTGNQGDTNGLDVDLPPRRVLSFKNAVKSIIHSEALMRALKHYSHRSDSDETDDEEEGESQQCEGSQAESAADAGRSDDASAAPLSDNEAWVCDSFTSSEITAATTVAVSNAVNPSKTSISEENASELSSPSVLVGNESDSAPDEQFDGRRSVDGVQPIVGDGVNCLRRLEEVEVCNAASSTVPTCRPAENTVLPQSPAADLKDESSVICAALPIGTSPPVPPSENFAVTVSAKSFDTVAVNAASEPTLMIHQEQPVLNTEIVTEPRTFISVAPQTLDSAQSLPIDVVKTSESEVESVNASETIAQHDGDAEQPQTLVSLSQQTPDPEHESLANVDQTFELKVESVSNDVSFSSEAVVQPHSSDDEISKNQISAAPTVSSELASSPAASASEIAPLHAAAAVSGKLSNVVVITPFETPVQTADGVTNVGSNDAGAGDVISEMANERVQLLPKDEAADSHATLNDNSVGDADKSCLGDAETDRPTDALLPTTSTVSPKNHKTTSNSTADTGCRCCRVQ